MSGDCTLIAHLAGLPSSAPGPDGAAPNSAWQAGIILRGNTNMTPGFPLGTSSSRYAAVFGTVNNGTHFEDDTMANGGGAYSSADLGANRWYKIQRVGDTFTTSVSANGTAWTSVSTNTLTSIGTTIYAGFFTYAQPSHNPFVPWASFDSFSLTGNLVGPPGVTREPAIRHDLYRSVHHLNGCAQRQCAIFLPVAIQQRHYFRRDQCHAGTDEPATLRFRSLYGCSHQCQWRGHRHRRARGSIPASPVRRRCSAITRWAIGD